MKEKDVKYFDSERIVIDWSEKCEDGYPVYPFTDSTILYLRETLIKHGVEEHEKVITKIRNRPLSYKATITENLSGKQFDCTNNDSVQDLHYIFNEIKDDYGKMLSVLYYVDPNSLGTLSEVILSELIKSVPETDVKHTGGSNGLCDIMINGKEISLKTTSAGETINLGSHEKLFPKHENNLILTELTKLYSDMKENISVQEMKSTDKLSDKCKDAILRKFQAIKEKLAGPDNNHHLIWIEKNYQKNQILCKINIHILKLDAEKMDRIFDESELQLTDKSWGVTHRGQQIVRAGSLAITLNVNPNFLKGSCTEEEIISIKIPIETNQSKTEIKEQVTDMFLGALKDISDTMYPDNVNLA